MVTMLPLGAYLCQPNWQERIGPKRSRLQLARGGFLVKILFLVYYLAVVSCAAFAEDSTAASLLDKARTLRQAGKPQEAKPLAEKALALATKQKAWSQMVAARQELSFEERVAGNYDRVLQLRLANLDTVRAHRDAFPSGAEESRAANVAAAYSWKRDYPLAVQYCREVLAAAQAGDRKDGTIGTGVPHALQALGINLYLGGQYDEARDVLQKAYAGYVAFSAQTNESQSASYYEVQVETLRWLQRVLIAQKHIEQALEVAELGRSRALAATLAGGASNVSPTFTADMARSIAREHGSTILEYSVQYQYDPDMLFIFSNFEDTPITSIYLWVIQPNGKITFHEAPIPPQGTSLVQMVRQARFSVGAYGRGVTVIHEPEATKTHPLQDLYNVLIAPALPDLPNNPDQVVTFVLQDWLFMVPFAALQDGSGHYLIEQHAIAVAPSLAVLNLTHKETTSARASKGTLIVGNPAMPKMPTGTDAAGAPLQQLPGAEREARAVAAQFHATPLVGQAATKDQVLRRLPHAELVHFATHGLLDQATGGYQSALALSPDGGDNGFLTTREVQSLKLNADLVVLSACDTALGKMSGDGILGLSRSFTTAGVPSVMVSLWAISDDSTAYLMEHFYQRLQAGQDKAKSLRGAMLDTKNKYPAPLNWAAFVLMGESAVAPGLRNVTGDAAAGPVTIDQTRALPIPPNIRDLEEVPNPDFNGAVSTTRYTTSMTVSQLVDFYKRALEGRGLKEVMAVEQVSPTTFSLVYRGPWGDREVVASGTEMNNVRYVSVLYELRRDDDAEFSPQVNKARAGIMVPAHATGLSVDTKFDFSKGIGDINFLSTMTPESLRDQYLPIFQQNGFTEHSDCATKPDGVVDCAFHGTRLKNRELTFHIETSVSHKERREVKIGMENYTP
jgi:CHAT domain-containing protein